MLVSNVQLLPPAPKSAEDSRRIASEVCDGIGIVGERRADVARMTHELVIEAMRVSPDAANIELRLVGAVAIGERPVLAVTVREIGVGQPLLPRVLVPGQGLSLVLRLARDRWPHREVGWYTPDIGPTSWFIVGDATPESAALLDTRRLLAMRGLEGVHRITQADIGGVLPAICWD